MNCFLKHSQLLLMFSGFFFPCLKNSKFLRITRHQVLPLISPPALGKPLPMLEAMGHKPVLYPPGPGGSGAHPALPFAPTPPATGSILPEKAQMGTALEDPPDAEHPPFPAWWFIPVSLAHMLLAVTRSLPCLLLPCCPRCLALLGPSGTAKGIRGCD